MTKVIPFFGGLFLLLLIGIVGLSALNTLGSTESLYVWNVSRSSQAWEGIRKLGHTGELAGTRWTSHANDRHGRDANVARDWVDKHGSTCAYRCGDGRTRFLCLMDNGRYAFVVLASNGNGITAWTMSKEDAAEILKKGYECVSRK